MIGPIAIAETAWGDALPDWIKALAFECSRTSQSRVAQKMNRSASLISQVLRNKYPGDMAAVEEVFLGAFQNLTVTCPALGNLPANECRDWQVKSRTFVNVNQQRVMMYRACNNCSRNGKGGAA